MKETQDSWNQAFAGIIAFNNFRTQPVEIAAEDRDLVARCELDFFGETDAVDAKRAELLEDYDPEQLRQEIQRDYDLSAEEVAEAYRICAQNVRQSRFNEDDIDWQG